MAIIATPLVPQVPVTGATYTISAYGQDVDAAGAYTNTVASGYAQAVVMTALVQSLDLSFQNELTNIKPMTQTLENNVKTGQANTLSMSGMVLALQKAAVDALGVQYLSMASLYMKPFSYISLTLTRGKEIYSIPICIFDSYSESHTEQGVFFTMTVRACGVDWTKANA